MGSRQTFNNSFNARLILAAVSLMIVIFLLMGSMKSQWENQTAIDHLVYTAPDLETGMDAIEQMLGVRPAIGGRHPKYGTRNALVSLGDSIYLEIIAPDPELKVPDRGRLLQAHFIGEPGLATWVLRTPNIEALRREAIEQGLALGTIESGMREKPDGTVLRWRLSDPYALPFDGTAPFLIDWGNTPHPAMSAPRAGKLLKLVIHHPDAEKLGTKMKVFGIDIDVIRGDKVKLTATIDTGHKIVTLE